MGILITLGNVIGGTSKIVPPQTNGEPGDAPKGAIYTVSGKPIVTVSEKYVLVADKISV